MIKTLPVDHLNLANSAFMRTLRMQYVEQTPVWVMRQAGRYLPEYQSTRKRAGSFLTLCRTPELACEVTLQPLQRYDLDAAIIFSDILVIPDAMGLGLQMVESVGPVFEKPITSRQQIQRLNVPDPEDDLGYVLEAIHITRQNLNASIPLIGFTGSPWTLAVYMIEGRSKTDFKKVKAFAQEEPGAMQSLLNTLSRSVTALLQAQAEAGVSALMIFDTWGGILNTAEYENLSLKFMEQTVQQLKEVIPEVPIILFTKGGGQWAERIVQTGCDAIGLDWTSDLEDVRRRVGNSVVLQGNLHPEVLKLSDEKIEREVEIILRSFGQGSGHIFNLGHGITPDINPDKVTVMVEAVHRLSKAYH